MKASTGPFVRPQLILLLVASLWLSPAARPAGLVLSPNNISNNYTGPVTLQISGLTNGETVLVERFLDLNSNGAIDAGESLAQSYLLTDGQVASVGGVRNPNIPGDDDLAANGQVQSAFYFSSSPEFGRGAGSHLVRLSSPGGRFTPVLQTLTVTQAAYSQRVTGKITSGGSAVPNAAVALLVLAGQDVQFVSAAVGDAAGNYSITAAPGTYFVLPAKVGLVSDFATAPMVTLGAGQVASNNLVLAAPTRTISGKLQDGLSGAGIPGVQLFIQSTTANTIAFAFSDASGNYSASVTADQWKIDLSDSSLAVAGYLRLQSKPRTDTTAGNATGVNISMTKTTALIYGSLKDTGGVGLPGVSFFASDSNSQYEGSAVTDATGAYYMGVAAGTWNIGPDNQNPALAGYIVPGTQVTLTSGQAQRVDFTATRATVHLVGRVIDTNGGPISDIGILGVNYSAGFNQVQTGVDGSFDLGVSAGTWHLQLESQTAAQRGLVGPDLSFTVTDGTTISNINYVVRYATAQLSGFVKDTSGAALGNINVTATTTVNNTNYIVYAQTDGTGFYQAPVFNGTWKVDLDCSALTQLGYRCANSQNVSINNANATLNFTVSTGPDLTLRFRHFVRGGDFGSAFVPSPVWPVSIFGYLARLDVGNDSNFPSPDQVFFTGPPGSGLTGSPAVSSLPDTNAASYFSRRVTSPATAPGGTWAVNYRSVNTTFNNVPDPQAAARLFVPLPTAVVSGGMLQGLTWVYKSTNGTTLSGAPAYVSTVQAQVFDRDLNLLDASPPAAPATMNYTLAAPLPWSGIGRIRMIYLDNLNNATFLFFEHASGSLTGLSRPSNNQFQFTVNGLVGQDYSVDFSTTLTNWNLLLTTNAPAGSFNIIDPNAVDSRRYYRVHSP